MSHDKLREMALEMVERLSGKDGATPVKPGEAATMMASLVALLDAYGPLIAMVNDAGEKALQACIHVIEGQPRFAVDVEGIVVSWPDGSLIRRDDLLEELMRLNGYVEAEEIVAGAEAQG